MFSRKCRTLTVLILLLVVIGVIMVGSSSRVWASAKFNDASYFMSRQAVFALIGVFVMYVASRISLTKLRRYGKKLFILCVIALILVLIPGLGIQRNGSRSWFGVGSFLIQPSEFFKIAIIIYVADFLAKRYRIKTFKRDLLFPAFLVMLGFGLILLQPDFGSGMVMVCSIVVMVLAADSPLSYFVRVGMLGAAGLGGLIISAPYRLARITSFIDPWKDPLGAGFQIIQSLFAISPGGILGVGFDNRSISYLPGRRRISSLPSSPRNSALSAEKYPYHLISDGDLSGVKIAKNSSDPYLCYVAIGLISLFAIQVMINLGVVVGLFPVTGITLLYILRTARLWS